MLHLSPASMDIQLNSCLVFCRVDTSVASSFFLCRCDEHVQLCRRHVIQHYSSRACHYLCFWTITHRLSDIKPPAALLGPIHSFRQADGGGNNLQIPDLGRAGQPYARSVQAKWCTAATALPDPGLVFDSILKRRKVKRSFAATF